MYPGPRCTRDPHIPDDQARKPMFLSLVPSCSRTMHRTRLCTQPRTNRSPLDLRTHTTARNPDNYTGARVYPGRGRTGPRISPRLGCTRVPGIPDDLVLKPSLWSGLPKCSQIVHRTRLRRKPRTNGHLNSLCLCVSFTCIRGRRRMFTKVGSVRTSKKCLGSALELKFRRGSTF